MEANNTGLEDVLLSTTATTTSRGPGEAMECNIIRAARMLVYEATKDKLKQHIMWGVDKGFKSA